VRTIIVLMLLIACSAIAGPIPGKLEKLEWADTPIDVLKKLNVKDSVDTLVSSDDRLGLLINAGVVERDTLVVLFYQNKLYCVKIISEMPFGEIDPLVNGVTKKYGRSPASHASKINEWIPAVAFFWDIKETTRIFTVPSDAEIFCRSQGLLRSQCGMASVPIIWEYQSMKIAKIIDAEEKEKNNSKIEQKYEY